MTALRLPLLSVILVWLSACQTESRRSPDYDDAAAMPPGFAHLFNGKDFTGWEGNRDVFRVEDGAVVGGTLQGDVPDNEYLCTTREYGDFELRLEARLLGPPETGPQARGCNAGIQVRSRRVPNSSEVSGYQVDMVVGGKNAWGCLWDEHRRNRYVGCPDQELLDSVLKPSDWNGFVIRCEGPRVRVWLNDEQTVDYTEEDDTIPRTGIIGLQIHGGKPNESWYRSIVIHEL